MLDHPDLTELTTSITENNIAFLKAIKNNDVTKVKELLTESEEDTAQVDVDVPDSLGILKEFGQTNALLAATAQNQVELVETLLNHKADASIKDPSGLTAAHLASSQGYVDILRIMGQKGYALGSKISPKDEVEPAVKTRYLETLRSLDSFDEFALQKAAQQYREDMVRSQGLIKVKNQGSPAAFAIANLKLKSLIVCMQYQAGFADELSPLIEDILKIETYVPAVAKLLAFRRLLQTDQQLQPFFSILRQLSDYCESFPQNYELQTKLVSILDFAYNFIEGLCENNSSKINIYLTKLRGELHSKTDDINSDIDILLNTLIQTCHELLPKSVLVPVPDMPTEDELAFFKAIKENDITTVRSLLTEGKVNVNLQDNLRLLGYQTGTALHYVAKNGQVSMFQLLLDHGADITICNEDGLRVNHLAVANLKNPEILELLASKGALNLIPSVPPKSMQTFLAAQAKREREYLLELHSINKEPESEEKTRRLLALAQNVRQQKALFLCGEFIYPNFTSIFVLFLQNEFDFRHLIACIEGTPINEDLIQKLYDLYTYSNGWSSLEKKRKEELLTLINKGPAFLALMKAHQVFEKAAKGSLLEKNRSIDKLMAETLSSLTFDLQTFMSSVPLEESQEIRDAYIALAEAMKAYVEYKGFGLQNNVTLEEIVLPTPLTLEEGDFIQAVLTNKIDIIESLLNTPHIQQIMDSLIIENDLNALQYAVSEGYLPLINLLLNTGADPLQRTAKGLTLAHLAAENEQVEVLELLASRNISLVEEAPLSTVVETLENNLAYVKKHYLEKIPAKQSSEPDRERELSRESTKIAILQKLAALGTPFALLVTKIGLNIDSSSLLQYIPNKLFFIHLYRGDIDSIIPFVQLGAVSEEEIKCLKELALLQEPATITNPVEYAFYHSVAYLVNKTPELHQLYSSFQDIRIAIIKADQLLTSCEDKLMELSILFKDLMMAASKNDPDSLQECIEKLETKALELADSYAPLYPLCLKFREAALQVLYPRKDPLSILTAIPLPKDIGQAELSLLEALRKKDIEKARTLLKDFPIAVNCTDPVSNDSPLGLAIQSGSYDMVKLLLEYGANPSGLNHNGLSFLHMAIMRDQANILALLIAQLVSARVTCHITLPKSSQKNKEGDLETSVEELSYQYAHFLKYERNNENYVKELEYRKQALEKAITKLNLCKQLLPHTSPALLAAMENKPELLQICIPYSSIPKEQIETLNAYLSLDSNNLPTKRLLHKAQNFKQLFAAIDELDNYGHNLIKDNSQDFGEKACALAKRLKQQANEYMTAYAANDKARIKELQSTFQPELEQGHKDMGEHREIWKPILLNIAIAATGVGLIVILVRLCMRMGFFCAETEREKRFNKVLEVQKNLGLMEETAFETENVISI